MSKQCAEGHVFNDSSEVCDRCGGADILSTPVAETPAPSMPEETTPEVAPETTPEVAPEAAPAPETAPAAPEAIPETSPEAAG